MQHTQYNFVLAVMVLLLAVDSAVAGRIAQPAKPNPILDGGDTHPCLAGPDLASVMDVTGQPVVPADAGGGPVPLPDQVLVPLAKQSSLGRPSRGRGRPPVIEPGDGPYVALDGRRLAPLLDPGPCPR